MGLRTDLEAKCLDAERRVGLGSQPLGVPEGKVDGWVETKAGSECGIAMCFMYG